MKDFLTFGINIAGGNFENVLGRLERRLYDIEKRLGLVSRSFNDIFTNQRTQRIARLEGELANLYTNSGKRLKGVDDTSKSTLKSWFSISGSMEKAVSFSIKLFEFGSKLTNTFIKLPIAILNAIGGFNKLIELISRAYREFERLNTESIKLQQFFQGSKRFSDNLVLSVNNITKDIVGVTTESVMEFMKLASDATKGFFNPKDVDRDTIKAINNLAGALGVSFSEAAAKFSSFMAGSSEAVMSLGESLGRVGINLADIAAASQNAQAGFAGANQRMQNLTALLNAKLKDSNEIAKQSISGVTELLSKNTSNILKSFFEPIYGRLLSLFNTFLDILKRNEAAISQFLRRIGAMLAPFITLVEYAVKGLEKLFSGPSGSSTINRLLEPFRQLGDFIFGIVEAIRDVFKALKETGVIDFLMEVYDAVALVSRMFLDTFLDAIYKLKNAFISVLKDGELMNQLFSSMRSVIGSLEFGFSALLKSVSKIVDSIIDFGLHITKILKQVNFFSRLSEIFSKWVSGAVYAFNTLIDIVLDVVDTIKSLLFTSPVFDALLSALNAFVTGVTTTVKIISELLKPLISLITRLFKKIDLGPIFKAISDFFNLIKSAFEVLYKYIKENIYPLLNSIIKALEPIIDKIAATFTQVVAYIGKLLSDVMIRMKDALHMFGQLGGFIFREFLEKMEHIGQGFSEFFKEISNYFLTIIEGVKSLFNRDIVSAGSAFLQVLRDSATLGFISRGVSALSEQFKKTADARYVIYGLNWYRHGDNKITIQSAASKFYEFAEQYNIENLKEHMARLSDPSFYIEEFRKIKQATPDFEKLSDAEKVRLFREKVMQPYDEKFRDLFDFATENLNKYIANVFQVQGNKYILQFKNNLGKHVLSKELVESSFEFKERAAFISKLIQYKYLDLAKKEHVEAIKKYLDVEAISKSSQNTGKMVTEMGKSVTKMFDTVSTATGTVTQAAKKVTNDVLAKISELSKQQQDLFNSLLAFRNKYQEFLEIQNKDVKARLELQLREFSRNVGGLFTRVSELDKMQLAAVGGEEVFSIFKEVGEILKTKFENGILIEIEDKTSNGIVARNSTGKRKVNPLNTVR